jgi:hypothetical protein
VRCLYFCVNVRGVTSKNSLDSDVKNGDTTRYQVYKSVSNRVVFKPGGAISHSVTELEGNDLKVNVDELVEAVAVHKSLFCRGELIFHRLLHCDWCCRTIYLRRVVLELRLIVLSYQEKYEGSSHQNDGDDRGHQNAGASLSSSHLEIFPHDDIRCLCIFNFKPLAHEPIYMTL